MLDAQAIGGELAAMVKTQFGPTLERMESRLAAMEKRLDGLPTPKDGKDADPAEVAAIVAGQVKSDIDELRAVLSAIPAPVEVEPLPDIAQIAREVAAEVVKDYSAKSAAEAGDTIADVRREIDAKVAEVKAAIPAPTEPTPLPDIPALVKAAVDAIPAPEPAPAPELPDIGAMVSASVEKAVKALPEPQQGASGVGLAGAMIDRDGGLVVTLTNGEIKQLGRVTTKGEDGKDGLGFDDMDMEFDGERTFTFTFQKGERTVTKTFAAPVMLDRGVFRPGTNYAKGDAVTYGGSVWIAQIETSDKPGVSAGWRLAVKAGRDGKDAVVKTAAEAKPITLRGGKNAR